MPLPWAGMSQPGLPGSLTAHQAPKRKRERERVIGVMRDVLPSCMFEAAKLPNLHTAGFRYASIAQDTHYT